MASFAGSDGVRGGGWRRGLDANAWRAAAARWDLQPDPDRARTDGFEHARHAVTPRARPQRTFGPRRRGGIGEPSLRHPDARRSPDLLRPSPRATNGIGWSLTVARGRGRITHFA